MTFVIVGNIILCAVVLAGIHWLLGRAIVTSRNEQPAAAPPRPERTRPAYQPAEGRRSERIRPIPSGG
jgi:hypothetical protein